MESLRTLAIAHTPTHILLGMKKRGFGAGKWNGFGGKLQSGETLEQATIREMQEESGLTITQMEKMGHLDFTFDDGTAPLQVHVYRVDDFTGEPVESEEMRPQWFARDAIPYSEMWADDAHWLPLLLKSEKFYGKFHFDAAGNMATSDLGPFVE